jgi:hypothetical protein
MGMMIIRHKVRDYGQWRPIFDGHAEMQQAAGLSNPRVYHSADSNKSEIVVVFDTKDTTMAKDFAASADLKEAMTKAGVVDTPTIYFLESIDWAKLVEDRYGSILVDSREMAANLLYMPTPLYIWPSGLSPRDHYAMTIGEVDGQNYCQEKAHCSSWVDPCWCERIETALKRQNARQNHL